MGKLLIGQGVLHLAKKLIFYTVASTVIAAIAQAAGADIVVTLMASLLGPPLILLVVAIVRYNGWLTML